MMDGIEFQLFSIKSQFIVNHGKILTFVYSNRKLYQIICWNHDTYYSSWIVGNNRIVKDGNMYVWSPFNAILFLLPFMREELKQEYEKNSLFKLIFNDYRDTLYEKLSTHPKMEDFSWKIWTKQLDKAKIMDFIVNKFHVMVSFLCEHPDVSTKIIQPIHSRNKTEQHKMIALEFFKQYLDAFWFERLNSYASCSSGSIRYLYEAHNLVINYEKNPEKRSKVITETKMTNFFFKKKPLYK